MFTPWDLIWLAAMPGDHEDRAGAPRPRRMDPARGADVAHLLASGVWTHDHPLMAPELEQLGLPVKVGVPDEERLLMDLFPQPRGREASVEYVSGPRHPPPILPRGGDGQRPGG
jgi:hypothetical protein